MLYAALRTFCRSSSSGRYLACRCSVRSPSSPSQFICAPNHSCIRLTPGHSPRITSKQSPRPMPHKVNSILMPHPIDESTSTLRLTQSLYDTYANLLSTSATIIRALDRADWYDRLLILSALVLFLAVVGWVLKRRVLDKVVGGVGWWVGGSWKLVRMGFGVRAGVGGGAGRGIGKAVGNAATEVGKAVKGSAAIASGMVAAGTAISGAAGGAGVSISEVAQAVKPKATSAEDMGAEHPYLSDSVVPREPESSAVVVELGPGTDEESRQRDEL